MEEESNIPKVIITEDQMEKIVVSLFKMCHDPFVHEANNALSIPVYLN